MKVSIFTDGGSRGNPGLAASAFCVYDEKKQLIDQGSVFLGQKTNNEAEYSAVIASLEWLNKNQKSQQITEVFWYLDSLLVVEQLNKHWKIKEARLQVYVQRIWKELMLLKIKYSFAHIPREQNSAADRLVNETLDQNKL